MRYLDTIEVMNDPFTAEDGTITEGIALVLNGEKVKGTFDPMALVFSTVHKRSLLELMTCSCGHAGCAGIFDGTEVKVRRYTVEWRDIDCGLPKRFYSFSVDQYSRSISDAYFLMRQIAQNNQVNGYDEDSYELLRFRDVADFHEACEWRKDWVLKYCGR